MEGTKLFTFFSYVSLVCFLIFHSAKCETYKVGDEEHWSTTVNYHSWSTKYTFRVNDTLVFKYIKGQHNVYEVTEDTYRSCDSSSGVLARYDSGSDEIKLTVAKVYWFICDIDGHCFGGMRLVVNVTEENSGSPSGGTDRAPSSSGSNYSAASKPLLSLLIFSFALGMFHQILYCY